MCADLSITAVAENIESDDHLDLVRGLRAFAMDRVTCWVGHRPDLSGFAAPRPAILRQSQVRERQCCRRCHVSGLARTPRQREVAQFATYPAPALRLHHDLSIIDANALGQELLSRCHDAVSEASSLGPWCLE